ncbi:uncharacterized protein LOC106671010 isoform X2 [Cimex lectularius]|uniref:CHK kinase-like domain-containing protein n=2 Tax=Cimex lectularius TaxID=79782 RepID=A0A8I6S7B1_CIMLE|nr:uncharacterized protein LOC106671010 isoform X2 [Cimex lectularius]
MMGDSFWLEEALQLDWYKTRIKRMLKVETIALSENERGFLSQTTKYKVHVLLQNRRKKLIQVIVKVTSDMENIKTFTQELDAFRQEIKMYTLLLPEMEVLMEEFEDTRERLWTDMITYQPYNLIVFKDLTAERFKVEDRRKCLGLEHSLLVMEGVARFHAMSRILLDRGLFPATDLKKYISLRPRKDLFNYIWANPLKHVAKEIKQWGNEWVDVGTRLFQYVDGLYEKLNDAYEVDERRFNVINHGDLWTCNLMFKYGSGSNIDRPIAIRFIDFQMSFYNTAAWDLTYFICTSLVPSYRRKYERILLVRYVDCFNYNLDLYKYEGARLKLESLESEMKRLELLRVLLLSLTYPIMTTDLKAFDWNVAFEGGCGINLALYQGERGAQLRKSIGPDLKRYLKSRLG